MDRLPALVVSVIAAAGCQDRGGDKSDVPAGRVNAAKVNAPQGATTEAFCDAYFPPEKAPVFAWPALADGGSPPAATKTWRWVNVWATWCKPCIEEMPRLLTWRDQLAAAGHPVELSFVSVDESADDVAAFRKQHPELPPSLRLAGHDQQAPWFTALGLDGAPPIPIHVFVAGSQVRCARAGGVREQDHAVVQRLLSE